MPTLLRDTLFARSAKASGEIPRVRCSFEAVQEGGQGNTNKLPWRAAAVGVSGPIAAGKTTIAREISKRGFSYTRISLVVDDVLRERGLTVNRANQQHVARQLREQNGQRWLTAQAVRRVADSTCMVVDGIRFPDDHGVLLEQFGDDFFHLHITADSSVRRERYKGGGPDEFDVASTSFSESQVEEMIHLAHYVFVNDGDVNRLALAANLLCDNIIGY